VKVRGMMIRVLGPTMLAAALVLSGCSKDNGTTTGDPSAGTATPHMPAQGDRPAAATPAQPAQPARPAAGTPAGAADQDPAVAGARRIFGAQCAMCHGPAGRGDGPAAANLNPRPRDHGSKEWQASVTDDQIK